MQQSKWTTILAASTLTLALALTSPLTAADDIFTLEAGDTPTLLLEQTGSFGFLPQSWHLGGNETGFYIMDATHNAAPTFRIFPGRGSSYSFVIASDGDVGMGTPTPAAALHVSSNGDLNDTDFLVEEVSSTEAARAMATLRNNGRVNFLFEDTSADGETWRLRAGENIFYIDGDGAAGNEVTINATTGNMTILGILNENSNREAKTNIQPVDPEQVLQKVKALPMSTWSYKKDQETLHLGPMAQDFHDAFGLGGSNVGISTYDTGGVALAAIQALNRQLEQKQERIELLESRLAALEAKVAD